jgi:hypothetical protein
MSRRNVQLLDDNSWRAFLAGAAAADDTYVGQKGPVKSVRIEQSLEKFLNEKTFGRPALHPEWRSDQWKLESISQKEPVLEAIARGLGRESGLDAKRERILAVAEEILLNGLISAPAVALEAGVNVADPSFTLLIEWSEAEMWIHGQDPYGAFFRRNFARSFSSSTADKTHGHSGRGLEIILEAATDLFIRSQKDWGTWVAALFDLTWGNRYHYI